jgi:hypothetical protein
MKVKVYYVILKIPDLLFSVIQLLLVSRFVAKILELSDSLPLVHSLYQITSILSFPLGMLLKQFFLESSQLYETFLVGSCLIYLVLYLIILDFLKILFQEDE